MVDPHTGDAVAPPDHDIGVRATHHHHNVASRRTLLSLDIAEHHNVAAGIV